MKKYVYALIFFILLQPLHSVFADGTSQTAEPESASLNLSADESGLSENAPDDPRVNPEAILTRISQKELFIDPKSVSFSDIGPGTMVQTWDEFGKRNMVLFVNTDGVHDRIASAAMDREFPDNFQLTMDVTVNDVFPKNQGGCYIGFSNEKTASSADPAEINTILFLLNEEGAELCIKSGESDTCTRNFVSRPEKKEAKLSVVHYLENTYLFIDDIYIGQYHDAMNDYFELMYGPVVFADGDTADCSFDNLMVRRMRKL
jgi:hypothetical protein